MEHREFDFFELIRILLKNRIFIIIFVAVVSVAAVVYSLLTPQIWESSASFYVVGDHSAGLPFDIKGLGGLTSSLLGADEAQNAINSVSAMKSREFSEDVIRHFKLIDYYKITEKDSLRAMDLALKKLRKNTMNIGYNTSTSLVTVSAETKDSKLSKDIVDHYLAQLEIYNREQKLTKGKMNREFLEGRVQDTRAEVDSLLLAVKDFQTKHNAIDIETQTASLISSYSDVISAKMQADIELDLARKNYAADSPIVADLKARSDALSRQIRELEAGGTAVKPRYLIDIANLPSLGNQYAQLKLNLAIKEKVYEFLYPQYEAARLEELRDMPSLEILDSPREAGMRLRPRRALFCVIAFGLAFIVAVLLTLIKNAFEQNKDRLLQKREEP